MGLAEIESGKYFKGTRLADKIQMNELFEVVVCVYILIVSSRECVWSCQEGYLVYKMQMHAMLLPLVKKPERKKTKKPKCSHAVCVLSFSFVRRIITRAHARAHAYAYAHVLVPGSSLVSSTQVLVEKISSSAETL